jgi:hypothetical protein
LSLRDLNIGLDPRRSELQNGQSLSMNSEASAAGIVLTVRAGTRRYAKNPLDCTIHEFRIEIRREVRVVVRW